MTVRPKRIVYLVHPSDPEIALSAVEATCFEWGGQYQFLIPCEPGAEPSPVWNRIIEKYDPDDIVDLVGASEDYLDYHREQFDRAVHRWENPNETMLLFGATAYGALHRWKRLRPASERYVTLNLTPLRGHPLSLALAFRFGHLQKRSMGKEMLLSTAYMSATQP